MSHVSDSDITMHPVTDNVDVESFDTCDNLSNDGSTPTPNNPALSEVEETFLARVNGQSEIYEVSVDNLLNLSPHTILALATYKTDFHRAPQPFTGNLLYVGRGHQGEYETLLVGELLSESKGTKFSSKGTHYIGTAAKPYYIDDKTKVKCALALGLPTFATDRLSIMFNNQIATLTDVIDDDKAEVAHAKKDIVFKEWTSNQYGDLTLGHDVITVVTEPIYIVPKMPNKADKRKKAKIEKRGVAQNANAELAGSNGDGDSQSNIPPASTNALALTTVHDPHVLPDYGGDLFQHELSRLRQMDFRDEDNNLIAPQDWYDSFRPGTFLLIRATLHAFIWETRRVYQICAHTVRILDRSARPAERRVQATMPVNGIASSSAIQNSEASLALGGFSLGKRARQGDN